MIVLHTADFISVCCKNIYQAFRTRSAHTAISCMKSKQILLLWQNVHAFFPDLFKSSAAVLMNPIRTAMVQNQLRKFSVDGEQRRSLLRHCCSVHSSSQVTSSQCCCGIWAALWNNILLATLTLTKVKEHPPTPPHQSCQYKHYSRTHQISYILIIYSKWFTVAGLTFRSSMRQTLRPLQHWASQRTGCGGKGWRSGPGSRQGRRFCRTCSL